MNSFLEVRDQGRESFYSLFSNSLRSNENNLIYFRKQLGNKGKQKFYAS